MSLTQKLFAILFKQVSIQPVDQLQESTSEKPSQQPGKKIKKSDEEDNKPLPQLPNYEHLLHHDDDSDEDENKEKELTQETIFEAYKSALRNLRPSSKIIQVYVSDASPPASYSDYAKAEIFVMAFQCQINK